MVDVEGNTVVVASMFIGHFALGFAAKRVAPRVSLAALFGAAQFADLLWPLFVAAGIERVRIDPGNTAFTPLDFVSYPYSHSFAAVVVWAIAFAMAYRAASRHNGRAVLVLAALVVSHWVLDWIAHRPDMPLYPGGPNVGLGLWNSVAATVIVEASMFAAGVWIYVRSTRARDRIGRWSLVLMVLTLLALYFANLVTGAPPAITAIWIAGLIGGALLVMWSWWTDRHRQPFAEGGR